VTIYLQNISSFRLDLISCGISYVFFSLKTQKTAISLPSCFSKFLRIVGYPTTNNKLYSVKSAKSIVPGQPMSGTELVEDVRRRCLPGLPGLPDAPSTSTLDQKARIHEGDNLLPGTASGWRDRLQCLVRHACLLLNSEVTVKGRPRNR
jgi:hypothetical protein